MIKGEFNDIETRMKENLWVKLAKIAKVSDFCLGPDDTVHGMLGTCLIPVCKEPQSIANHTDLGQWFDESIVKYTNSHQRGYITRRLPVDAFSLHTPIVAAGENTTCARVVGCSSNKCVKTPKATWNCSQPVNISYNWAHIILPPGWFFTCGQQTFNYIPANLSDTFCCLSRLVLNLPRKEELALGYSGRNARIKRDLQELSPDCNSHVHIFSDAEFLSLGISLAATQ